MGTKKRINIYVDSDEWDKLQRNIDCSRSEWINRQIKKKNECIDEVEEINLKLKEIDEAKRTMFFDEKALMERKEEILKQRKINEESIEVREKAMKTIRIIEDNQGYIELDRIKHIAKKHVLNPDVLIKQCKKENIEIRDLEIVREEIIGLSTGKGSPY